MRDEFNPYPVYHLGLDLGQLADYTALTICEVRFEDCEIVPGMDLKRLPVYRVRALKRWPLQTPYTTICADMKEIMRRSEIAPFKKSLVIDFTGVGVGISDMLTSAEVPHQKVSIHGGDAVTQEGSRWRVPKRDLVSAIQSALGTRRLHIAEGLPEAAILKAEMQNFRVTINPSTAHDSYAAWQERDHDDLLLSLALAVWWGERQPQYTGRSTRLVLG